jgi:hypothetical protein
MAARVWLHNLEPLLYLFLSTSPPWMLAPWRQDGGQEKQSLLLHLAVVPRPYRCCPTVAASLLATEEKTERKERASKTEREGQEDEDGGDGRK